MSTAFANEPILELRRSAVRGQLAEALAGIDRELPLDVPVLVGGERAHGRRAECRRTRAARAASWPTPRVPPPPTWTRPSRRHGEGGRPGAPPPAADRAAALIAAAAWLRERRLRIAALQVRECAKPWPEADADVCEAIDFYEYYARPRRRARSRGARCSR